MVYKGLNKLIVIQSYDYIIWTFLILEFLEVEYCLLLSVSK